LIMADALKQQRLVKLEKNFAVYVGIDFGTDGTGLAYALPTGEVFVHQKWKGYKRSVEVKPKTRILLDAQGAFLAFGQPATNSYITMGGGQSGWMLFERFKMALYEKKKSNKDNDHENEPEDEDGDQHDENEQQNDDHEQEDEEVDIRDTLIAANGKEFPADRVFIEALKYIKSQVFKFFTKNKLQIENIDDIQWILTVPAIWSEKAKYKMEQWAFKAGLINKQIPNHLKIVYEPDCASLSIQYEIQKLKQQKGKKISIMKGSESGKKSASQLMKAANANEKKDEQEDDEITTKQLEHVVDDEEKEQNENTNDQEEHDAAINPPDEASQEVKTEEVQQNDSDNDDEDDRQPDEPAADAQPPPESDAPPQSPPETQNEDEKTVETETETEAERVSQEEESEKEKETETENENQDENNNDAERENEKEKVKAEEFRSQSEMKLEPEPDLRQYEEAEMQEHWVKGEKYILIDAGGGTCDVACHEILGDFAVQEIVHPTGGPWGSTYIDDFFIQLLHKVFGQEWLDQFQRDDPASYTELIDNFRVAKQEFWSEADCASPDEHENGPTLEEMSVSQRVELFANKWHNVQLPFDFCTFLEERVEEGKDGADCEDLETLVESTEIEGHKRLISLEDEYLRLNYMIWTTQLFDLVVQPILDHCTYLLNETIMKDATNYICLVGGLGSSKYLQHRIKQSFGPSSKYGLNIIIPSRPILSVVDGAARFGLQPDYIQARTLSKTYGNAIDPKIDVIDIDALPPGYLEANQYRCDHTQALRVRNIFSVYARKNQTIHIHDKPIIRKYKRFNMKQKKVRISVYSSDEEDPKVVKNKPCAKTTVVFPPNSTELSIIVELYFSDTKIRVWAFPEDSPQNKKEMELDYEYSI